MALRGLDDGRRLLLIVPDDLPLVRTDPGLLERVLANLFANALTYSPPRTRPELRARQDGGDVQLDIVDHGRGAPDELKQQMFEPFERLDVRGGGAPGGIGLGLAVVKGFLDIMGGSVEALDTPGGGLTMRVRLPAAAESAAGQSAGAAAPRPAPAVTKVLVIDDEAPILHALRINLSARKYEVSTAADGTAGLAAMARDRPDVLILDLGLPDMDGTDVIRGVRGWTSTPIIVLSAWGQESQKVAALDAGADDYVTKPFGMDELLARLRAAVRRATPAPAEPVVATEHFTVDLSAKRVTKDGADVRLTPTEWQLLEVLARNADRLVTQRQLLQEVWGPGYLNETSYLRVYMANLRRKLEPSPSRPRYLLTEPGMGYRFVPGG